MKRLLSLVILLSLVTAVLGQKPASTARLQKHNKQILRKAAEINNVSPFTKRILKSGELTDFLKNQKNATVLKQQLDSLVEETAAPIKSLIWDRKSFFFYDVNGKELSETTFRWNDGISVWENDWKTDFFYNTSGYVSEIHDFSWNDISNQWEGNWKVTYTYDLNGNIILAYDYSYDVPASIWIQEYKTEYTWNAQGNMELETEYFYDPVALTWVNSYKNTSTYSANGLYLDHSIEQNWDTIQNSWYDTYKSEYSYNPAWQLLTALFYVNDTATTQWNQISKSDYSYDTAGFPSQRIDYFWNSGSSQWENSDKREWTYDVAGNLVETTGYSWDFMGQVWTNGSKDEYTYNMAYTVNDLILPYYTEKLIDEAVNMLVKEEGSDYYSGSWHDSYAGSFYYSTVNIIGINEPALSKVTVYPNPSKESVRFSWNDGLEQYRLELSDLSGRSILEQAVNKGAHVSLNKLERGIYFYSLSGKNGQCFKGKLIVD